MPKSSSMRKRKAVWITEDVLTRINFIRCRRQEYLICLSLNTVGEVISRRTVAIGTLNSAMVHPRDVFAGPIKDRAAAVIIAHNHPSGYAKPSKADISTTQQLVAAGLILGIDLKDHVIVAKDEVFSFRAHTLI